MIPYTDKAKKALNYANRLSRSSGCNYVGTEHILAGLLKEGTGVAAEVLTANNVELEALLKLIDELVAAGDEVTVADRDGYSPRTQMVLDRAREMADRFDSERIGTEHLLLAIIKEGDCACTLPNARSPQMPVLSITSTRTIATIPIYLLLISR